MAAALGARHLNATHAKAAVFVLDNILAVGRKHEAWPATSRVELGATHEEQRPAARAVIVAGLVVLSQHAGKRALRALLPQHMVLLGCQRGAPIRFSADNFVDRFAHGALLQLTLKLVVVYAFDAC